MNMDWRSLQFILLEGFTWRLSARVWCPDTWWLLMYLISFCGACGIGNHDPLFILLQEQQHLIISCLTQRLKRSIGTRLCICIMKNSTSWLHLGCYLCVARSDHCICEVTLIVTGEVLYLLWLRVLILCALKIGFFLWYYDQYALYM